MPTGTLYSFGPFRLDSASGRLMRDDAPVRLAARHVDVLAQLVAASGGVVSKDALVQGAWRDVAVTDNSLEQAISALRRALGSDAHGASYIDTVPRQGYRFAGTVSATAPARMTDAELEALLAPHRTWVDGRAALETLEREQILLARRAFEAILATAPDQAHVGLANACVMQFEMTRADEAPDVDALALASRHAREACRVDAGSGEAWATLGFVLDRTGHRQDALAASRRAVALEPDNWRHHVRLAYVGWGEERLRAANRALALLPGLPMAHWLAATVHVAREVLGEAERELDAGIAAQPAATESRFSPVALHWLRGLVCLARGDESGALAQFERELALESSGQLYARECCANTWYAIGVVRHRQGHGADAAHALEQALGRVPRHPLAHLILPSAHARPHDATSTTASDLALRQACALSLAGAHVEAARAVESMLAAAPPGPAGWLIPVEPLLHVSAHRPAWSRVLAGLRARAA